MLTELCAEIHNYFCKPEDIKSGSFTIAEGSISPSSFLQNGQYYRIVGSVFNDGVHKFGDSYDVLEDEVFDGYVWPMSVPLAVVSLSEEIDDWVSENAEALNGVYASESFGGYSYSLKGGGNGSNGGSATYTWADQFASRLRPYRKLREI